MLMKANKKLHSHTAYKESGSLKHRINPFLRFVCTPSYICGKRVKIV